jgi:hypothetical protein
MKCYMDDGVDPCQDFYKHACGRWNEYHPIPKDKSGYDTFEILREDLHANLIAMFEEPISAEDSNATAAAKLLYNSCMDTGGSVAGLGSNGHWPKGCQQKWPLVDLAPLKCFTTPASIWVGLSLVFRSMAIGQRVVSRNGHW